VPRGRYRKAREGQVVKAKGMVVPYTFWPDAYIQRGRILTANPWACMRSSVNERFKLGPQRNRALAFLLQAEEFYEAGREPRLTARPLLYYYSFMNLSKAFLTVRHNATLSACMHGLKEGTENVRKRMTITSQEVKVNDVGGTRTQVYREMVQSCGFAVPAKPKPVTLVTLLEQVLGVHDTYCQSFGRCRRFFPVEDIAFRYDHSKRVAWVSLSVKKEVLKTAGRDSASSIRDALADFEEVDAGNNENRHYESKQTITYGRSPLDALSELVRITKRDVWSLLVPGGFEFYVTSIPAKKCFAQIASHYQAMFYFGSVTRYRPDDLAKLHQSKYGWLIEDFINTQCLQFIYLLGSGLLGVEMVIPKTVIG